uniref:Uncharacterized protein n=1 Tax=Phlebotomus papatasi TaxID=29031 RepID=A0A1B0GPA6_PHLPP
MTCTPLKCLTHSSCICRYNPYGNECSPLYGGKFAGPSAAYGPEAMGWMDGQAQMMHRPPGDPAFHQGYAHYPPAEYYGHHL